MAFRKLSAVLAVTQAPVPVQPPSRTFPPHVAHLLEAASRGFMYLFQGDVNVCSEPLETAQARLAPSP